MPHKETDKSGQQRDNHRNPNIHAEFQTMIESIETFVDLLEALHNVPLKIVKPLFKMAKPIIHGCAIGILV